MSLHALIITSFIVQNVEQVRHHSGFDFQAEEQARAGVHWTFGFGFLG
jgi:hypothetical protein